MELSIYVVYVWTLAHTLAAPVLDSPPGLEADQGGRTQVSSATSTSVSQVVDRLPDTSDFLVDPTQEAQRKSSNLLEGLHHYDIIVPTLVDNGGNFLSYDVTHKYHLRRKRFAVFPSKYDNDARFNKSGGKDWIFYKLSVYGKDFHFNLTLNRELVSPSYLVEYRNSSGVMRTHRHVKDCHYNGVVQGDSDSSRVAISNCYGLHGMFTTNEEDFFVEPLWNDTDRTETEGYFHVVYKRSAIKHKDSEGHCGNIDRNSTIIPHWWTPDPVWSYNKIIKPHHYGYHHKDKWRMRRRKRSVSKERNVETLVVADKMMVGYHGNAEIEPYLLTVMNIVAKLYHDDSIGNAVNIIVTRLVLLTQDQPDLEINHHADRSLESFCHWQNEINPAEDTPQNLDHGVAHHDNAVLITRYDICTYKNQPCGTLGLAPVAGMCESDRSCSINEDIGLASAFTIAHEIGHNFGMQHDGAGNKCGTPGHETAKIMAAQLTKNTEPFSWSACSKEYITGFLDAGRGKCLENSPPDMDLDFPDELPGRSHDGDAQCQYQYGSRSRQCKDGDVCREIWCINPNQNDQCVTSNIPAADGTYCHTRNIKKGWCFRGRCMKTSWKPKPVDGRWGAWTDWGFCTRTCGGGVESSERHCANPRPDHGGKYCIGERKRYRSCNVHDCPINATSFREVQCRNYDEVLFRGKHYTWKPFNGVGQVKPCALNCLAEGFNFYTERATKVVDGTRCHPDSFHMCINGECRHVGCDRILGSSATEDKCRVCGGDESTCETITGDFDAPLESYSDSYKEVVKIPQGAVHIRVAEKVISRNYLALKGEGEEYYINGAWTIDWPRKFEVANTVFLYERPKEEVETLTAVGPTSEDIYVMLLLQDVNLGIEYQYNIPITNGSENGTEYVWQYTPWSKCTVSCARGISKTVAVCVKKEDRAIVASKHCVSHLRPNDKHMYCNADPCPPEWVIGDWSDCSKTCGGGVKTRSVKCTQAVGEEEIETLPFQNCTEKQPRSRMRCQDEACPPHWASDGWSTCQPSCGPGVRSRNVYCVSAEARYMPDHNCESDRRPPNKEKCHQGACPPPSWVTGAWAECSAKCGKGQQMRSVACRTYDSKASRECEEESRPHNIQECEGPCTAPEDECKDVNKISYCPLVLKFEFCSRNYFRQMCCKTCTEAGL